MIDAEDRNERLGDKKNPKTDLKSNTPVLDNFSRDLIKLAQEGKLDPVIGRENEIIRLAQILSRRKKNNPILVGEPGCGKTAVVEGLAMKIFEGDCPQNLLDKRIVSLDMTSIVAGTKYRGQFEERMKVITDELREAHDVIIFIDENFGLIRKISIPEFFPNILNRLRIRVNQIIFVKTIIPEIIHQNLINRKVMAIFFFKDHFVDGCY